MKKLAKILSILMLVIVSAFALTACGGGDGEGSGDGVTGTYKLKSITYEGVTLNIGDEAPWGDDVLTADSVVMELKADGVLVSSSAVAGQTQSQSGTWTQDGNTINGTIEGQTVTMTLDGKTLTYVVNTFLTYVFEKA